MKNSTGLLILLLPLAAGAGTTHVRTAAPGNTHADQPAAHAAVPDYFTMKGGKMMRMTSGKLMPMTQDRMMGNGSVCMTDGVYRLKNGFIMRLKEGQRMTMDGQVTTPSGPARRPIPKATRQLADRPMGYAAHPYHSP